MRFIVKGTPAPQGSKRAVVVRRNGVPTGKANVIESSNKVGPWRQAVVAAVGSQVAGVSIAGPVQVKLTFLLNRPKSHYRNPGGFELRSNAPAYPSKRPDLDKYIRSTLDGLTDAGVWLDDSQVVAMVAVKRYTRAPLESPGAIIEVLELVE